MSPFPIGVQKPLSVDTVPLIFPAALSLRVVLAAFVVTILKFAPLPRSACWTTIGLSLRLESPSRSGSEPGTVGQQRLLK